MKTGWLTLTLLAGIGAWAAPHAPDFTLGAELVPRASSKKELRVWASPPAGHHINVHAPMKLELMAEGGAQAEEFRPKQVQDHRVVFEVPASQAKRFTVSLFLCDDRNTYCERHTLHATWADGHLTIPSQPAGGPSSRQAPGNAAAGDAGVPLSRLPAPGPVVKGFILNQPELAFARAEKEGKPLLIDFYGIWCPPCNELDERVFSKAEFQRKTRRFVKLKMDVDAPGSWALSSRYRVAGYPTVIFAAPNGEEIGRVVGFRSEKEMITQAMLAWDKRHDTLSSIEARAARGDRDALDRLGLLHLQRQEYALAVKELAASRKYRERWHEAEIGSWMRKTDAATPASGSAAGLEKALRSAIQEFPESPDSLDWRAQLASLLEKNGVSRPQVQEQWQGVVDTSRLLSEHPERLSNHDVTVGDLLSLSAEAEEHLGRTDLALKGWQAAARKYRELAGTETERGYNLEQAYCWYKAGNVAEAEKIYRALELAYPSEFTFYYRHARMSLETGQLDKARELAEVAWAHSYGQNRLNVATVLARIYRARKRPDQAAAWIEKALRETPAPRDPRSRIRQKISELRKMESELRAREG